MLPAPVEGDQCTGESLIFPILDDYAAIIADMGVVATGDAVLEAQRTGSHVLQRARSPMLLAPFVDIAVASAHEIAPIW